MSQATETRSPPGDNVLSLIFVIFGGETAWTVHLITMFELSNYLCSEWWAPWLMHAATAILGGTALVVLVTAERTRRRSEQIADEEGRHEEAFERQSMLAGTGVGLASLALLGILFNELALLWLGCDA